MQQTIVRRLIFGIAAITLLGAIITVLIDRYHGQGPILAIAALLAIVPIASIIVFMTNRAQQGAQERLQQFNALLQNQLALINEQALELQAQQAQLFTANRQLALLAQTDGLTGLGNRRGFQDRLQNEFHAAREGRMPLSLLLLDVDGFKAYNDEFGHPEGDTVLQELARILDSYATDRRYVARYGGEEFVLLLSDVGAQGAISAAEHLRNAIERHPWKLRPVTASIGVATMPPELNTAQELVDGADRALYRSKEDGRNRVTHARFLAQPVREFIANVTCLNELTQFIMAVAQEDPSHSGGALHGALMTAYDCAITSWARLIDKRDKETCHHSERVTLWMDRLAHRVGMNAEEVLYCRWGAMLHDVGKIGIPDEILHKPGKLMDDEFALMRQHTLLASEMLSPLTFLGPAIDIPRYHHERWDGTGYPSGLKGEEIPLCARLFAVIDVWDALLANRPYRKGWHPADVEKYLVEQAGTHFDPAAVSLFLSLIAEYRVVPTEVACVRSDRLERGEPASV